MSVNSDAKLLQQVPLFQDVDPAHLQVLAFSSKHQSFSAGQFLFKKGRSGSAAYLVLSGHVAVYTDRRRAKNEPIARVSRGGLLGEMSMIGKLPYSVSAQAIDQVQVLTLSNSMFMRVCGEFPEVGARAVSVLAGKLDSSLRSFQDVQNHFKNARPFSS